MTKLFKRNAQGRMTFWEIEAYGDGFETSWGVLNGSVQGHFEDVNEGLQSRTIEEQIEHRMNSCIQKKLDIGYVYDMNEALSMPATNQLGLIKPMLAKRYDRVPLFGMEDCAVQFKYDGHRCLIHRSESGFVAYSRNGKPIETIEHILERLTDIPVGTTLDGELYCHKVPLQTISSWVKRNQVDSHKLSYHVYDQYSPESYIERYKRLQTFKLNSPRTSLVPTWFDKQHEDLPFMLNNARRGGYEGLIIRRNTNGYQDGVRASQLVKVKSVMDDEFTCIDIEESKDGHAILICETANRKLFKVTAPGGHYQKQKVLQERNAYIGKTIRVEYANLTKEGKPFHPVATTWRDKESE